MKITLRDKAFNLVDIPNLLTLEDLDAFIVGPINNPLVPKTTQFL